MTDINNLASVDVLSGGDSLPVWSLAAGTTRRIPFSKFTSALSESIQPSVDAAQAAAAAAAATLAAAVKTDDLATASTVSVGGYTAGQFQSILDMAVPLQDYVALRSYTGRSLGVRLTASTGIAGNFYRDATDTTSADNGGTIIVDIANRRWKRYYTDSVSVGWFGTNGAAVNTAIAVAVAAGILLVTVPKGVYLFGASEVCGVPQHMTLRGEVPGPFDSSSSPTVKIVGATFSITNTSATFMTLYGDGSKIENLLFYYPNQVAVTASAPTVYPRTVLSEQGGGGTRITRCTFVNAYDAIFIKSGRSKVEDCIIGAFHNDIRIDEVADWVELVNIKCQVMWDVFSGAGFPQPIDTWVLNNSLSLRVGRVDSLVVSGYSLFSRFQGISFEDSTNTGLTPRCGYGRLSNVDLDYVAYGIVGLSANAVPRGYQFTNLTIGANASGVGTSGQWGIGNSAGGTQAPTISVVGGSMRGTWAVGNIGVQVPPAAGRIFVSEMRGLNPGGAALVVTPAVPASGTPVTNNYPFTVRIGINGSLTNLSINGNGMGASSGMWLLAPGETITLTYSSAPTWAWQGL